MNSLAQSCGLADPDFDPVRKIWTLSRYDHVIAALRSPQVLTDQHDLEAVSRIAARMGPAPAFEALLDLMANYLVNTADGSEHRRRRAAFADLFQRPHPQVRQLIGTAIEIVLTDLPTKGPVDATARITDRIAAVQVAALVDQTEPVISGIFTDFRALFRRDTPTQTLEDLRHMNEVAIRMRDLFHKISADIDARLPQQGSDPGAIMFLTTIIVEGLAAALGQAVGFLARDAAMQDRLRGRPELIAGFVRECLRFGSPVAVVPRRVSPEGATLAGHRFDPGARLLLNLARANRDPARFDRPDMFDPNRPAQPTLAFAAGPHTCMGIAFTREIMAETIARLLDRYRLVAAFDTIEFAPSRNILTPLRLPVVLAPGEGAA